MKESKDKLLIFAAVLFTSIYLIFMYNIITNITQ